MGFLDNLRSNSQQMSEQLKSKTGQLKNKDFARGSMAICALIAAADGSIDAAEKQKMTGFISSNDTLSLFDANELREMFEHFAGKLAADYDFGKVEAIQAIGKLKGKPDQARAVIQVGVIIGGADGSFDEDEQRALREACNAVGISPSEFDL
jgi:tellurite resistance protein TerB